MAAYAKVLKDPSGNQILPYTRSKLVYMDDNSTVQDAVTSLKNNTYTLPTASSSTLGGVKIGSNIKISSGTISVATATTSALGVVKVGSNLSISSGTISVPDASVDTKGAVKIWRSIEEGYNDDRVPTMNAVYNYILTRVKTDSYHNVCTPYAEGISTIHGKTANGLAVVGVDHCLIAGEHHPLNAKKNSAGSFNMGYTAPYTTDGAIIGGYYSSDSNINNENKIFTLGNGSSSKSDNCFFITTKGNVHASGTVTSSGADYAEYFEWLDSNINNEDRRGLFVTLNGDKITLASKDDNYILGIISGNPTVIGDGQDIHWKNQYERDIFGSYIHSDDTYNQLVLNSECDLDKEYIPRSNRPEWDPVGLMGKLICIDDGTCEVNGYCYPSENGIGTKSDHGYRVMKRIDDIHIQVLVR